MPAVDGAIAVADGPPVRRDIGRVRTVQCAPCLCGREGKGDNSIVRRPDSLLD